MKALLIYPRFPETYWSFRHALRFQGKRAAQPPLGLMTIAPLLPASWNKRLVDMNVEPLKDSDLAWADVVLLSGMHVQRSSLVQVARRCRERGIRVIVGGPIASTVAAAELAADHVVIGEAETLIAELARDVEAGSARAVYQAAARPAMELSPLPDLSLIRMKRYSTMTVQYSRGCPFNCEFCDIIAIYGRQPRTKPVERVLAELNQLHAAGWRGPVFMVDDNFIGNKARVRVLLDAMAVWSRERRYPFRFITEASLNLADDRELLQAMKDAGFTAVFLGIETPDESSLKAADKLQNTRRDLLESVAIIQEYGLEAMGGFILGFDTDQEDVFDRLVDFIQKSAIPIAMVNMLQAIPGTQLFRRLSSEGRIVHDDAGGHTTCELNFIPRMNAARLVAGYRSVLQRIYSCDAFFERVKMYVERCRPRYRTRLSIGQVRAFLLSVVLQGVWAKSRASYWKFVISTAMRYPRSFGPAMTLAVMGYHFQCVTRELSKAQN